MPAATLARSARGAAGLTQREVAGRSGIAGSSLSQIEHGSRVPTVTTLEAILRATGRRLIVAPSVRSDAADIAVQIADAVARRDRATAFRRFIQLNDNLAAERGASRVALTLTDPLPIDDVWDAAIAALCAYRLNGDRLPVPDWASSRQRSDGPLVTLSGSRYRVAVDVRTVPVEFSSRGLAIDAATLESV